MVRYAHEVDPRLRALRELGATRSRPISKGPARNAEQAARQETMKLNRVLLRGRYDPLGREVWDVVKVEGGETRLYAQGLYFFPEAVELARACMSGKTFVSLAGARALLTIGKNSSLAQPSREIGLPAGFHLVSHDGLRPGKGSKLVEVLPGRPRVVEPT